MINSFPSVPLHLLCLDVFPFFALLGTPIPPSLSLGIISFKYISLTIHLDVLSATSRITVNTLVWKQQPHCLAAIFFSPKIMIFRAGEFCFFYIFKTGILAECLINRREHPKLICCGASGWLSWSMQSWSWGHKWKPCIGYRGYFKWMKKKMIMTFNFFKKPILIFFKYLVNPFLTVYIRDWQTFSLKN